MSELAVLGGPEFVLGFQLAGIKRIFEVKNNTMDNIREIMEKPEIKIVITDSKVLDALHPHDKNDVEDSIKPVFVPVSTEAAPEALKRLIKKSIGIDLWKD